MLVDVKVPVLAESVSEATLLEWQKKVGDPVQRGDNLIDIETDKVTLEVSALQDGVLSEILQQSGATVSSDEVIARIETAPPMQAGETTADKTASVHDLFPETSVAQQEPAETDTSGEPPAVAADAGKLKTSPAVRNMMAQQQINEADIVAHTLPGRITKTDIVDHLQKPQTAPAATPSPAAAPPSAPAKTTPPPSPQPAEASTPTPASASPSKETAVTKPKPAVASKTEPTAPSGMATTGSADERMQKRVPMTRLRRRAAERLLGAQHENAILTTFNEVNMQAVMKLRNSYREEFEKSHGVKLGFMSFFTQAVVEALKQFPIINASVDGDDILYHGFFDIGIAVSSPRGLVVPIVRDADQLSLADIEKRIRELGGKARDGKLSLDDLTGGTFTITNGGVFGSLVSTPIINPPQSAILGMHKIQERPIAEQGKVVIRPMMYLALSYDHRIIDGSDAVQFLVAIKKQIEEPSRLLLQI